MMIYKEILASGIVNPTLSNRSLENGLLAFSQLCNSVLLFFPSSMLPTALPIHSLLATHLQLRVPIPSLPTCLAEQKSSSLSLPEMAFILMEISMQPGLEHGRRPISEKILDSQNILQSGPSRENQEALLAKGESIINMPPTQRQMVWL